MNDFSEFDQLCMQAAFDLALHAQTCQEVPVGAVIAQHEQIIARGYNQPISSIDPTAHAEIIALRAAAQHLQNYRLVDTTMYVTLEPCPMCMSAMIHARVKRVVFATPDHRTGACGSVINLQQHHWNHKVLVNSGLMQAECAHLLQQFFKQRR